MKIGIGLPNPVPATPGAALVDWARRAEAAGFSSLATIDRIVYPSYESLIALAGAAAVTDRVGLLTNVLLAPVRNEVLLAKEAASVDRLSGGRLTLGLGVGGRRDDYSASGVRFETRGRRFDAQLESMTRLWRGEPPAGADEAAVPVPGREIPILIGGTSDRAVERTLEHGVGWTSGGGGPDPARPVIEKLRRSWEESGRPGRPRIVALAYFALGPNAEEGATRYLKGYYRFLGEWADRVAASALITPESLNEARKRWEDLDIDELILDPTIGEPDQVDRLADVML